MSLNYRTLNLAGFLACAALIISALIMQHVFEMEPCPLCIFQRVSFMVAGAGFLLGSLHAPKSSTGRGIYSGITLLSLFAGIGLALRHIWLQNLPADQVPSCGPGLDYMMEVLPYTDVVSKVLSGSGECAEVSWTFLGLSIPWWTLFAYLGLAAIVLISLRRKPH